MSEPTGPGMDPEEYAAALDRFLDGLWDDPAADGPADAQVRADTDSIARALGLIGGALAAEGGGVSAAAGAVPPVAGSAAGGATVVQLSSWRSKLNPRVLAAAASLVVLLGVGIPVATSISGGSDSDDAATAIGAPETAAEGAPAPAAATLADDDAYAGTDTAAGAVTDTSTAGTGALTGAAPGSGQAADAQALEESRNAAAAPAAGAASSKAAKSADAAFADAAFADAVACARAIFVGTITGVQPEPDGAHFKVTFLVEDWIVPSSGAVTATYRIYGSTANSPGLDENVLAGQRRLFVVPDSEEDRIYAYREKDWPETKKQIKAVRDKRAGEGCA